MVILDYEAEVLDSQMFMFVMEMQEIMIMVLMISILTGHRRTVMSMLQLQVSTGD